MEQNLLGADDSGSSRRLPLDPHKSPGSPSVAYNINSPCKKPAVPYDSSQPSPYDSPQYEEKESNARQPEKTLMSMVDDDYVDANIAVTEEDMLSGKKEPGEADRGRQRKNRKRKSGRHSSQTKKKKQLLETPLDQRPLCKFFQEGKCSKGDDCSFNHILPPKRKDVCKFYLNGNCSKGDRCSFMHNKLPCKYFHMGDDCSKGDKCRFSHEPLTEETRPLFEKNHPTVCHLTINAE